MLAKLTLYRHSDKVTSLSLYDLRAQIIRDRFAGPENVDAPPKRRGLDPEAMRVPPK